MFVRGWVQTPLHGSSGGSVGSAGFLCARFHAILGGFSPTSHEWPYHAYTGELLDLSMSAVIAIGLACYRGAEPPNPKSARRGAWQVPAGSGVLGKVPRSVLGKVVARVLGKVLVLLF